VQEGILSRLHDLRRCFLGGAGTRLLVLVLTGSDWVVTEPRCFLGGTRTRLLVLVLTVSGWLVAEPRCFLGGACTRLLVLILTENGPRAPLFLRSLLQRHTRWRISVSPFEWLEVKRFTTAIKNVFMI
jgi:hypothetical protein